MTPSLAWVALAAIILFWAVGAYNRLVRLRSDVVKAFSALDSVLAVQPALIQATLPAALPDGSPAQWRRLSSAGEQYARSLANARSRPLDPEAISALCAAQSVLDDVWQIPTQPGSDPQAGLMDGLRARLARLADQAAGLREAFDASVFAYNTAVGQFPAMLLARIWGFKPAGLIQPRNPEQNGE